MRKKETVRYKYISLNRSKILAYLWGGYNKLTVDVEKWRYNKKPKNLKTHSMNENQKQNVF